MKKIEIVTWYKCNCSCIFCTSPSMRGDGFSTEDVARLLAEYAERGIKKVDFGGGEPAARGDLPALAAIAKQLGYETIGVKSNGMRFAYPEYVELCMESGVNDFAISTWGFPPRMHDELCCRPGAFEMTEMGLKHLVDFGADVCVDYLVTTRSLETLADALAHLSRKVGVRKFRLWLYSIFGGGGRHADLLPSLAETAEKAIAAYREIENDVDWVKTSHVPPCLLGDHREMYYNISDLELFVITPGHSFMGEESPFEEGQHLEECDACRLSGECPGPRKEYVKIRGGGEIKAVR